MGTGSPHPPHPPPRSSCSFAADALLRTRGFERTHRLGRRVAQPGAPAPDESARIESALRRHRSAAARLPWHTTCLSRSLALWFDLGRRGVASEICIGVRGGGAPLDAHAWVVHHGRPINEVQAVVDTYEQIRPGSRPL